MKEKDPTGKKPSDSGAKLDAGKPRAALVIGGFANALQQVIDVGTFGAEKYTDDGWQRVVNGESRYMDAAMRHLLAHLGGEDADKESGLSHLAHAAWNILAVSELRLEYEQ